MVEATTAAPALVVEAMIEFKACLRCTAHRTLFNSSSKCKTQSNGNEVVNAWKQKTAEAQKKSQKRALRYLPLAVGASECR